MFNIDTAHRPMPYCVSEGQTHFSIYDYFQIVQNNNLPCLQSIKIFFSDNRKKQIVFKKPLHNGLPISYMTQFYDMGYKLLSL